MFIEEKSKGEVKAPTKASEFMRLGIQMYPGQESRRNWRFCALGLAYGEDLEDMHLITLRSGLEIAVETLGIPYTLAMGISVRHFCGELNAAQCAILLEQRGY
jgi:hypothetical protein